MAMTHTATPALDEHDTTVAAPSTPTAAERVLGATDHLTVGRVVVGTSLFLALASAAVLALAHLDTAVLDNGIAGTGILDESVVLRLAQNAPIGLMLCGVMPLLLGLATVVVPRQVGSPAISFPRLSAFANWTWLLSAVLFVVSVAADGSYGGANEDMARLGNLAVAGLLVSLAAGAVCVAVTVLTLRPLGMGLRDVPFFSFSMVVTAGLWVLTLPAVLARIILVHIARPTPTDLAVNGVEAVSWLFRQPSVYIVALPVLGIVLDSVAVAAGGRQRFRGAVQVMIGAAGLLSFGAWAQTDTARSTLIWVLVSAAAALPLLGLLGAVGDTVRQNRAKLISPLGYAIAALLLLLLAALTGLLMAIDQIGHGQLVGFGTAELSQAQLYFVLGAALAGGLGGAHLWAGLTFGDQLPEAPAKGMTLAVLGGGALLGLGQLVLGLLIANDAGTDPRAFAVISAVGAALLALAALGTLAGGLKARRGASRGDTLLADPWGRGATLEWAEASAVPATVESPYPLLAANEEAS